MGKKVVIAMAVILLMGAYFASLSDPQRGSKTTAEGELQITAVPRPTQQAALVKQTANPATKPPPPPATKPAKPEDGGDENEPGEPGADASTGGGKFQEAIWEGKLLLKMKVPPFSKPNSIPTVKGVSIEPIDDRNQKNVGNAVIKNIKFLLPQVNSTLKPDAKRVFMDLGARTYPKGSIWYFQRFYPESGSFQCHAFELLDLENQYGPAKKHFAKFEYHRKAAWIHSNGVKIKGRKMGKVADGIESIKNDKRQEWEAPSIDMAAFLKDNFTEDDFIVVKLDIEGGEWTLLPHLIKTGAISLIDELLFECHPLDYGDYGKYPKQMPPICVDLTNDLRVRGVYAHRWV